MLMKYKSNTLFLSRVMSLRLDGVGGVGVVTDSRPSTYENEKQNSAMKSLKPPLNFFGQLLTDSSQFSLIPFFLY